MKLTTGRVNSLSEILFLSSLVINNLIALFFLNIAFINPLQPFHKYSAIEFYLRFTLYGFIVSLFFSLISFAVTSLFKTYFIPALTGRLKFFLIQLCFLFLLFLIAFFTVFVLPELKS